MLKETVSDYPKSTTPIHLQHHVAEAWANRHILQEPLDVILHHASTQHSTAQHST
jgi:hypothetical protein